MRIRADTRRRAVVRIDELDWVDSPLPGVQRKMLERDGGEVARATSIVRYGPGSSFSPHEHGGGEEFLVLDGVFSDEHGDYATGTYVRNPPGSRHTPRSAAGCTLFVKLRQMAPGESQRVVVEPAPARWQPCPEARRRGADAAGVEQLPLYSAASERVSLVRLPAGGRFAAGTGAGGREMLILEGEMEDEQGCYPTGTWIRDPAPEAPPLHSRDGCLFYLKAGHLTDG